ATTSALSLSTSIAALLELQIHAEPRLIECKHGPQADFSCRMLVTSCVCSERRWCPLPLIKIRPPLCHVILVFQRYGEPSVVVVIRCFIAEQCRQPAFERCCGHPSSSRPLTGESQTVFDK